MTLRKTLFAAFIIFLAWQGSIAHATEPSWDGVWLVQSYKAGPISELSNVWRSILTINGNRYTLSKYWGLSKDVAGTFTLNPSLNAIDFTNDEIVLREEIKYPPCTSAGIYKMEGNVLTICFNPGHNSDRPKNFDQAGGDKTVFSLVRANADFKSAPTNVAVTVIDPLGKPVANASLFSFMSLHADKKKPQATPEWKYIELAKTGSDGVAKIAYDDMCVLGARDAERHLVGFFAGSPASLQKGIATISLQPECHVTGTITSKDLTDAGKQIEWNYVYLCSQGERIGGCSIVPGKFEFIVSPGQYTLWAYGTYMPRRYVDIVVPQGHDSFVVPPIDLQATKLVSLMGKPAPELDGVVAWKGTKVKLADLKGQYVLLNFWGYWCNPCCEEMPALMDLHEKYHDKGLAILSVHVDLYGEVDSAEKLDRKTEITRSKMWNNRNLPFPVALVSGGNDKDNNTQVAQNQYGITGYPTTILIDRSGNVVGDFSPTEQQIKKLLESAKQ